MRKTIDEPSMRTRIDKWLDLHLHDLVDIRTENVRTPRLTRNLAIHEAGHVIVREAIDGVSQTPAVYTDQTGIEICGLSDALKDGTSYDPPVLKQVQGALGAFDEAKVNVMVEYCAIKFAGCCAEVMFSQYSTEYGLIGLGDHQYCRYFVDGADLESSKDFVGLVENGRIERVAAASWELAAFIIRNRAKDLWMLSKSIKPVVASDTVLKYFEDLNKHYYPDETIKA